VAFIACKGELMQEGALILFTLCDQYCSDSWNIVLPPHPMESAPLAGGRTVHMTRNCLKEVSDCISKNI